MIDRFDLSYVARAFCRFYIGKLFPFPKKYITVEENPPKDSENFNSLFQPQLLIRQKQIKCCQM